MPKKIMLMMVIFCLLVAVGCANKQKELTESEDINQVTNQDNNKNGKLSSGDSEKVNQDIAKAAENKVLKMDEITEAVAVNSQKELFLAYKIHHLERFHMKKIEKDVKKKLEEQFPKYKVTVSSDLKLFLETTKLKQKVTKKPMKNKKLAKEIKKLVDLKNEKT